MPAADEDDRPVLPWRFVAGAFLHLAVPAYLLTLIGAAIAMALDGRATREALVRAALPASAGFALCYGGAALVAVLLCVLLDPVLRRRRARREAADPERVARRSARRLERALAQGRAVFGEAAAGPLRAIAAARWDHADPADQRLSADLDRLVSTAATAMASALPERRAAVAETARQGLERIAAAAAALDEGRRRLDGGDVDTVTRYLAARYPAFDSDGGNR